MFSLGTRFQALFYIALLQNFFFSSLACFIDKDSAAVIITDERLKRHTEARTFFTNFFLLPLFTPIKFKATASECLPASAEQTWKFAFCCCRKFSSCRRANVQPNHSRVTMLQNNSYADLFLLYFPFCFMQARKNAKDSEFDFIVNKSLSCHFNHS